MLKKERRNQPYSSHSRFIWMGIALSAAFWMLEAAVHVLVLANSYWHKNGWELREDINRYSYNRSNNSNV